jgi:peptide/nickel transport system substrate-binding protein
MLVSACAGESMPPTNGKDPEIKNPDTFIIAEILGIDSLDPAYAYDVASIGQLENIYETLVRFDGASTTDFVPVLATEWTISDDGKKYRFKIREGVTYHNGNPLTPEDVEYSFERGMVQDYGMGPQWMIFEPLFGLGIHTSRNDDGLVPLEDITGKVEVHGQWVQFNLATSYEPFLQILSSSWGSIVDKEWCVENGDWDGTQESYETLNNPPHDGSPLHSITNGTGPFMLEHWESGIEISLVRNDDYWGEAANFKRVVTKIVEEWSIRKLMLELGDADCVYVPDAFINELKGAEGITGYEDLPHMLVNSFFFQFDISPESTFVGSGQLDGNGIPPDFFSDINVRKGFNYAFDWETYIEEGRQGRGQQIASPIVEGVPYYNPEWLKYYFDLDKAEEHLREAWDGQVWENGFTLTLAYSTGDIEGKTASEILQHNLFSINPEFKVKLQVMSWPTLLGAMNIGLLPMFLNGWVADYPDPHNFVFPFMHSNGTFSAWQNYHDPEVDALIEQGIASNDPVERQAVYNQLAGRYYQDPPGIIITQIFSTFFFRDWVQGFIFNPIQPSYVMYVYRLSKEY